MKCTKLPERIKIKFKKFESGGLYIISIENAMSPYDIGATYGDDIENAFVNSGVYYQLVDSPTVSDKVKILIVNAENTQRSIYTDNVYCKDNLEEFVKLLKEADTNLRKLIIEKAKKQREAKARKKVYVITV